MPTQHRDGLSKRQQTLATLFPGRTKTVRPQQLSLGGIDPSGFARVSRCPGCGASLADTTCEVCEAFLCVGCDHWTTGNGGDGARCFRCLVTHR